VQRHISDVLVRREGRLLKRIRNRHHNAALDRRKPPAISFQ
jgi:hypothetical protein